MGTNLYRYMGLLVDRTTGYFQKPLNVVNWTERNEGLHRSIHKIKSLKTLPPIIIYAGGSSEFVEKKFDIKSKDKILKNFNTFADDRISSLIITFPVLSKFFYEYYPHVELGRHTTFLDPFHNDGEVLSYLEMTYKLYESEFINFMKYIRDKKTNFLIVTPPQNLDIPPKKICSQSTSEEIAVINDKIEQLMRKGKFKQSVNLLQKLGQQTVGNAKTYYLLGQSLKNLGLFKDAKVILYQAQTYDCALWRGNIIFNKIMITEAEKHGVDIIDFNAIVNNNFGKNILFLDELYPQEIYYDTLIKQIYRKVKEYFNIKE